MEGEIDETLASLFAQQRGELEAYFRLHLPDPTEAEDYAQQVFEKLLRYDEVREPLGLLRTTARRLLIDAYKQAERRPRDLSWEELVGEAGDGLDHLPQFQTFDEHAFAREFDSAVRALDPDPRDAFILGELRGLTSRETGVYLGVSHKTANLRRAAATAEIREEMNV